METAAEGKTGNAERRLICHFKSKGSDVVA